VFRNDDQAWLFHRGTWTRIVNPLYMRVPDDVIVRRQSLHEYRRRWWKLGPTFLYPDYSGILLSTYAYEGTRNLPEFMIWINAPGTSVMMYAQDLPDLLQVLNMFAPLVLSGIFTDIYLRGQQKE